MSHSVVNISPAGGGPSYSPSRDIAYVWPAIIKNVAGRLDEAALATDIIQLRQSSPSMAADLTETSLAEAVRTYIEGLRLMTRERWVTGPDHALRSSGFTEVGFGSRLALLATLGQTMTCLWFDAIRDVTLQGVQSPGHADLCDMVAAARVGALRLAGNLLPDGVAPMVRESVPDDALRAARAEAEVEELQRVLSQKEQQLVKLTQQLADVLSRKSWWAAATSRLRRFFGRRA